MTSEREAQLIEEIDILKDALRKREEDVDSHRERADGYEFEFEYEIGPELEKLREENPKLKARVEELELAAEDWDEWDKERDDFKLTLYKMRELVTEAERRHL